MTISVQFKTMNATPTPNQPPCVVSVKINFLTADEPF